MNISRRSFLVGATGLLSALGALELLNPPMSEAGSGTQIGGITLPPTTLRGYGTLAATFHPLHGGASSLTHITCESAEKAHLVQAKYLSDLTRLPGIHDDTLAVGGSSLPIRRTAGGGVIACYARGRDVLILAAASPDLLKGAVQTVTPPVSVADFQTRVPVPMYLDRWDKYGLLMYYEPFTIPADLPWPGDSYDYNSDLAFARNHDTGLVIWNKVSQYDTPEGLANMPWWAWLQENARKMGVPMHLNSANDWPVLWLSNRYREETQLRMPQFMGGYYDVGGGSGAQGAISWLSQAGEDALLGAQQQTVKRFGNDPNIVGWMEPHGETSQLPMSLMSEYGPLADRSLRGYLQQRFGKLSVVSQRWYGSADHLASWSEIHAPEIAEFAGFGPHAIDLRGTWRVKYAAGPVPAEWYGAGFDDSGWDEFVAPGNDRMMMMPRTPLVYRRTINVPEAWLTNQPEITLYVWDMSNQPQDEMLVYVNGAKAAGQVRNAYGFRCAVLNVTKILTPGRNLVVLNVPHAAINYRVYLTTDAPKQYPDLGPQRNAQWADYNAWTLWYREAQMRRGVEMIRQIDPNSSVNLMTPRDDLGPVTGISKDYGCRFHDTGAMAGFWTDDISLMMSGARLPVTAEPGGGAPNLAEFQKYWGRWLTEGLNGIHYFQHLGQIMWNPVILAEFEKNRRMYEAIGKYHVPFAEVGILYSTRNYRLTNFPWDPDLTDRWQRSGYYTQLNPSWPLLDVCPRDGISEEDLGASLPERFRVVIDSDTNFMDEPTLAGIERYVRAGGVFITNGQTGRHTEVVPDTWPISRLTGYSVVNVSHNGAISVAPGQAILTSPGWTPISPGGMSLKKVAADCRDLLLWQDGSVAAGMRPLGKGWIVHIGPAWGMVQTWQMLMAHFGARQRVPATVTPQPGLHFRHYVGNTGLQDVWVLFNEADTPLTTDLTFLPDVHPASLSEIVTGTDIAITRDPAGDKVPGISLAGHQTVMYLSPRADVAASPWEWLTVQRGWWQGTKQPPAKHLPTPAEQQRFTLDLMRDWAYKRVDGLTDDQAAALAQPTVDDHAWERRDLDVWLTPNDHTAKRLILRRKFTVPPHWTAGPVFLSTGDSVHVARTFLDGKPLLSGRATWDGASLEDCGGTLKAGTTHLLTVDVVNDGPAIGIKGLTWLTYLPDPKGRQDLAGDWASYSTALHGVGPVSLPGNISNVAYLHRAVTIDRAHEGRNVVLYVSMAGSFDSILINGTRLTHTRRTSDHSLAWFNITPMVKFGVENTIELATSPDPRSAPIKAVELRYYEKGFFP